MYGARKAHTTGGRRTVLLKSATCRSVEMWTRAFVPFLVTAAARGEHGLDARQRSDTRIQHVPERIPDQVDGNHRGHDGHAGAGRDPPAPQQIVAAVAEVHAPLRDGGRGPSPRKLSDAPMMIDHATAMVASTITGAMMFGRMCWKVTRRGRQPRDRAA